MDSGATTQMTGAPERLTEHRLLEREQEIRGYDNSSKIAKITGMNQDGKPTLLVPGMPTDRDLLSAWYYAQDGCIVFFGDGGYVVAMTKEQQDEFESFIQTLDVSIRLKIENGTYIVDYRVGRGPDARGYIANVETSTVVESNVEEQLILVSDEDYSEIGGAAGLLAELPQAGVVMEMDGVKTCTPEVVAAYTGDVFFNGRANFTTEDELILSYMLSGFSPNALRKAVQYGSVKGINPKVTTEALKTFERTHGRSPDFFQISRYANQPHQHTFDPTKKPVLERPGQLVGIDHAFWDFNEASIGDEDPSRSPTEVKAGSKAGKRVEKLRTLGGASFFSLALCYVTGFPVGRLGKPGEVSTEILREFLDVYRTAGRPIETIVADVGIVSESMFRVFNTNVIKLLIASGVKYQKVMPNDHSIGGNKIEVCVRYIKEKMRS
jgi:hypothetical protein